MELKQMSQAIFEQGYRNPVWCGTEYPRITPYRGDSDKSLPLWIWEMPRSDGRYTVALDPSLGEPGRDNAAIEVLDENGVQVAEVSLCGFPIGIQGALSNWIAYFYNEAKLVVEVNGIGAMVLDGLSSYPNLWKQRPDGLPGYMNNITSRNSAMKLLASAIESGRDIMRSPRLRREFCGFFSGRPKDCPDDLISAFLVGHYCKGY